MQINHTKDVIQQYESQKNPHSGAHLRIVCGIGESIADGIRLHHFANIRTADQRTVHRAVYDRGSVVDMVDEQPYGQLAKFPYYCVVFQFVRLAYPMYASLANCKAALYYENFSALSYMQIII